MAARAALSAAADRGTHAAGVVRRVRRAAAAAAAGGSGAPDEACLPRCADPDDQKFLQLALAAGASWLLSKDKELLKLDRRTRRAGLFAILLPQDWLPAGC